MLFCSVLSLANRNASSLMLFGSHTFAEDGSACLGMMNAEPRIATLMQLSTFSSHFLDKITQ